MSQFNRRAFVASAAAMGATLLWAGRSPAVSRLAWRERRELFPQGVASGDPDAHSVILWTRYPLERGDRAQLIAEISLAPDFRRVVATMDAPGLSSIQT